MKRAVLILSIIAILGIIAGVVVLGMAIAAVATQCQQFANDQTQLNQCTQSAGTQVAGQTLIAILLYIVGGLCAFVGWILGLVKTAQIGRWGWFVLVLLISPLGSLIYGIAGPTERAVPAMATMPPPYQPPYQQ